MRDWPERIKSHWFQSVFHIAVIIDRDGVINVDTHYPHDVKELQMVPEAIVGLRSLASLPLHIIVVSNQAGIAQGRFTRSQMSEFNCAIRNAVEEQGGRIDAFYFCPHEEEKNLPNGVVPCYCAKPRPGMLLEAQKDFGLDLGRSFMIGDRWTDVEAGNHVGCTTFKVTSSNVGQDADLFAQETHEVADYDDIYMLDTVSEKIKELLEYA